MTPSEFERSLRESKESGWTEKLTSQLLSIHTQKGGAGNEGGAPTKDSGELTDSGSIARDY